VISALKSLLVIALVLSSISAKTEADDPTETDPPVSENQLIYKCDPGTFALTLKIRESDASPEPGETIIDPADLTYVAPNWVNEGQYVLPLIRYEQCGPITLQLKGDSYNSNIEGEAGAYPPFVAVRLVLFGYTRLPTTGDSLKMTRCERGLPRAPDCPEGFAVALEGRLDPQTKNYSMTVRTESTEWLGGDTRASSRTIQLLDREDFDRWPKR
jgi:hypothetical protein